MSAQHFSQVGLWVRLCQTFSLSFLSSGHGSEPRDVGELPYKVLLSSQRVFGGEKVTISLTGSGFLTSTELKGFLMQVCSVSCVVSVLTIHHN